MTWESVDLPEPFGPIMACTSPLFTTSDNPCRISRSSTRTCRFLTSSNGILTFLLRHPEVRAASCGALRRMLTQSSLPSFETATTRPPQDDGTLVRFKSLKMIGKMLANHSHFCPHCLHFACALAHIATDRAKLLQHQIGRFNHQPTLPSRLIEISFCASTANSIGSGCSTSLTKPFTTSPTASSWLRPP